MADRTLTLPDESITEDIYNQFKARFDRDPDSLNEAEKCVLLVAALSKGLADEEKIENLKQQVLTQLNANYDRANGLMDQFEAGTFAGDKNVLYRAVRALASDRAQESAWKMCSPEGNRLLARHDQVLDRVLNLTTEPDPEAATAAHTLNSEVYDREYKRLIDEGVPQNKAMIQAMFIANPELHPSIRR